MNDTDQARPETSDMAQGEQEAGWGEDAAVSYPEFPGNPHNHRFTISFDGRGPMVVVRGNTAAEIAAGFAELEEAAVGAVMGNAWSSIKAAAAVASGVGPVSVMPGAPAAPQAPGMPTPPPFGPNVSVPQAPGLQGNPGFPAQPAPAAQQGPQNQEYRNAGWYRLDVPFPKKGQFDGIVAQYQLQKGRPSEGGSYSFNSKGEKAWYVSPQVAGAFPMFSPVPA